MSVAALLLAACTGSPAVGTASFRPELAGVAFAGQAPAGPVEGAGRRVTMGPEGELEVEAVRLDLGGDASMTVTARHSTWRLSTGVVVFSGAVHVERGEVALDCERLEVHTREGVMVEAMATGGVAVRRSPWSATGDRARLDAGAGTVVLEGQPRVSDGRSTLRGRRVTLSLDDQRVDCDGCELRIDPGPAPMP